MAGPRAELVTFLFTDIEKSTELLQQLGDDRYAEVLAEHTRLLRRAFDGHGGHTISDHGDGVMVAFPDAASAVAAAIEAQQAVTSHRWPEAVRVRVRMGLHTGVPATLAGDYVGLDVHRAARIGAAGHGGQILLSEATRLLVEQTLPRDVSVRDMGAHRFKDMKLPEKVFQIIGRQLTAEFPPIRSLSVLPNNLPADLTSFIGRERDIAEVKLTLGGRRMVTLIGTGGCGKTRLALRVAADLVEEYPDGVWLVELGALSDPSLVPQTVAAALRVREEPEAPLMEALTTALRHKSLLLVLDNCEHVVSSVSALAVHLLKACPGLRVLATSRQALRVDGEFLWRVPSLPVPDRLRVAQSWDALARYGAVRLFLERAAAVQPTFSLTAQAGPAVAEICRRLDGIPLAIEFAAARMKMLSVDQIATRLDDRFRLLAGRTRTAPARHQTLRAVMDWSYDLLSAPEQLLLRRLSVFAGGWTLEAAEAVGRGEGLEAAGILDELTQLADQSLVVMEVRDTEPRYRLLETIRQYAKDRLVESGELGEIRRRQATWVMGLAERAEPNLRGREQAAWLERLEAELDNIRAAIEWSLEDPETDWGVRIAGALQWFWYTHGYFSEGTEWLKATLAVNRCVSDATRAKALYAAATLALNLPNPNPALALATESRAAYEKAGDLRGVALVCTLLGYAATDQGNHDMARGHLEEALHLSRSLGDELGIRMSLNNLGELERCLGNYAAARALYEEGLVIARQQGEERGIAILTGNLGLVARQEGDCGRAEALLCEALRIYKRLRHRLDIAGIFMGLAGVAETCSEPDRAARLLGAADGLLGAVGAHLHRADRLEYDRTATAVRAALDESACTALWAEGCSMPLDDAMRFALRET